MPIPSTFIDELVSRTDIADLIGGYVRLTRRSGANMFGLCPFHSEKTPSFAVNTEKQIYHCFGCGKGGGAISFVMDSENLPFREAVEFLAGKAGMTVPEDSAGEDTSQKRSRMYELNRDAARFFHEMLLSPIGEPARKYVSSRGISAGMVKKFGLGAAPDAWTMLTDAMTAKGYSTTELTQAGLSRSGRSAANVYDWFRNRLIFPIIDVRGNVVGFSGRVLSGDGPKYLNSPDTIAFSKSRNLFALNLARKSKAGMLILAEGNIDVVTLHQAGFDCAVASLGTALTAEQVRLMARYASSVVLAYDTDEAGRKAALGAIALLEKTEVSVRVADFGTAKDPDEYIRTKGADAFRALLDESGNHIEYRLATLRGKHNLTTDAGRLAYITEATDLLSSLPGKPEREVYGARAAQVAGVSAESVSTETEKLIKIKKSRQRKEFERGVARPAAAQNGDRSFRYEDQYSAAAEEGLVRRLIRDPALITAIDEESFTQEEFTSPFLAKVFRLLIDRAGGGREVSPSLILSGLSVDEAAQLTMIIEKPDAVSRSEHTIREYIAKIRAEKLKTKQPDGDLLMEVRKYKERK